MEALELKNCKFNSVYDYIEFRFPLSLDYEIFKYSTQVENHSSALAFPQAVEDYLSTEKQLNAIVGPFGGLVSSCRSTTVQPEYTKHLKSCK